MKLIVAEPTKEICEHMHYAFANYGFIEFWMPLAKRERIVIEIPKVEFIEDYSGKQLIPIHMRYYNFNAKVIKPKLTKEDGEKYCYKYYLLTEQNIIPYLHQITNGKWCNYAPRGLTSDGDTVLAPAPYTGEWAKWLELRKPEIRKLERKLMTPAEVLQELRRMNGLEDFPFPDLPF
jgi:hypothetical protein